MRYEHYQANVLENGLTLVQRGTDCAIQLNPKDENFGTAYTHRCHRWLPYRSLAPDELEMALDQAAYHIVLKTDCENY